MTWWGLNLLGVWGDKGIADLSRLVPALGLGAQTVSGERWFPVVPPGPRECDVLFRGCPGATFRLKAGEWEGKTGC